jgi:HAD superfamily hydrolase (TIGR01509 family)
VPPVAKPYELVIFDCDGVLVDTERLAIRIDRQVLAAMGWSLTEREVVERFVGRTPEHMTRELSAHLGRELPADWDEQFTPLYRTTWEAELEPVPGITGVLDALDAVAQRTCVASSGSHRQMRFTLGLTGLWDRFAGRIYSAEEVAEGKPAPDLFLHAAARMGVDPSGCAVVEDSVPGVEAALAAGMDAYAYGGGVTDEASLRRPGVTTFADMAELPGLLL